MDKQTQQLIDKTIKFLNTHNGRDKLCRTMQFGSKFASLQLENYGETDYSKRLMAVSNSTSTGRKLFRLFKSLNFIQAAVNAYLEELDPVVKVTSVVQNFCLAVWLYYDHFIWAGKAGLLKGDLTVIGRRSNAFWLVAMLVAIVKQIYLLQQAQKLAKRDNKQVSRAGTQLEIIIELLRNVFDVPLPLTALSEGAAQTISPSTVSLLATLSSIIGFYQVWTKIK